MAAQYYYLVSSLPGLLFSSTATLRWSDFEALCHEQLREADRREFDALAKGDREAVVSDFSRNWLHGERQLRNAVVRQRALRSGVDEKRFLKEHAGYRVDAELAVNDAFSRANPLERELALDRFRWNVADELSLGEPFGLAAVLAYAVKLKINERWQSLTAEKGMERLDETVGVVGVSAEEAAGWSGLAQL